MTLRHWVYRCPKCQTVGSVPVDVGTSMLNAIRKVDDAHKSFHPECHDDNQGRWIEILYIEVIKH